MKKLLVPLTLALCCAPLVALAFGQKSYTYDHAEQYTKGGAALTDPIRHIDVDWLSGSVTVCRHDKPTVEFSEIANSPLDDTNTLYYYPENDTLHIRFAQSGKPNIDHLSKALTICLPQDCDMGDIHINTASASIRANAISADAFTLNSASGAIHITDSAATQYCRLSSASGAISAQNLQPGQTAAINSTSGAISATLTGDMEELTLRSTSGKIDAQLCSAGLLTVNSVSGIQTISAESAELISASSTSGAIDLTLRQGAGKITTTSGRVQLRMPENPGYVAEASSVSGRIYCPTDTPVSGKRYIIGEGENLFQISTVSGKITLDTLQ